MRMRRRRRGRKILGHPGKSPRVIAGQPRSLRADIRSSSDEQHEVNNGP